MIAAHVPNTPHGISPEWLERTLALRHPGVRVESVEVVDVREVTNTHAFLRVTYHESQGAPTSMFCKMLPLDPSRRPVVAASGMGVKEVLFYDRLAPDLSFRVPEVHVAFEDPDGESFVLLMEDLVRTGCRVPDGTWGITPDSAAAALEDLATLHVRFEDPTKRAG